jgi:hypothetical protein
MCEKCERCERLDSIPSQIVDILERNELTRGESLSIFLSIIKDVGEEFLLSTEPKCIHSNISEQLVKIIKYNIEEVGILEELILKDKKLI